MVAERPKINRGGRLAFAVAEGLLGLALGVAETVWAVQHGSQISAFEVKWFTPELYTLDNVVLGVIAYSPAIGLLADAGRRIENLSKPQG